MKTLQLADVTVNPRFVSFEDGEFEAGPAPLVRSDEQGNQAPVSIVLTPKQWREHRVELLDELAAFIDAQIAAPSAGEAPPVRAQRARANGKGSS